MVPSETARQGEVLDANAVGELLGVTRDIVNLMARKRLDGFPPGRRVGTGGLTAERRWLRSEILNWLKTSEGEASL